MYQFKIVETKDVNQLAIDEGIYRQTSFWKDVKSRFKSLCINGYDENNQVVLSCLMLRVFIPLTPFSMCYAPNGFLCDYNNQDLLQQFTSYIIGVMKKKKIAYIVFDPLIVKNTDFQEDEIGKKQHQGLLQCGFKYQPKNANEYMQINNNYIFKVNNDYLKQFEKSLVYDIRLCQKRGVAIEKYTGYHQDVFDIFYNMLLQTSERKNFGVKSKAFYEKLYQSLGEYVHIYLAKYHYHQDYQNTLDLIEKAKAEIESAKLKKNGHKRVNELNDNIMSYQKRLEAIKPYEGTEKYIGAAFYIRMGKQSHYLLGANDSSLRFVQPTSLLIDEMIKDSLQHHVDIFNLGGSLTLTTDNIKDDPMYSVYKYKQQLNGNFLEYYGDYYLINNSSLFFLEEKYKLLRRLNNRL